MVLEVFAHLTVRPGQLEGFKKQAAECIRITKEKDTRTLRYDWFISSDGTECEVHEAYTGPEGARHGFPWCPPRQSRPYEQRRYEDIKPRHESTWLSRS